MRYLCRLCSSVDEIFDVYHPQLESGDQLRHYILLASGIKILWNDPISRMVCHSCCEIAIKLNKYRSIAVANDKFLKEKYNQPYTPPITDKDELLSAASRIFNINDVSIIKDDADPLELLNVYIDSKSTKLAKINGETHLNNTKIGNQVNVSDESKVILKDAVTTYPKILTVGSTHPENGVTHLNNDNCSVSEDKPLAIPNNKALTWDIAKTITPCNNHNAVDNVTDSVKSVKIITQDGSAQTSFSSPLDIFTHDSVKKLYQENSSLQIPKEVYSSDISPMISLDPNEVSDWYAQQLQMLNDKLKNVSNKNTLSSSEDETHFLSRPRLRKRKYKRVIDSSDSNDDEEWLPFKMQAQDVKSTKPSRSAINASSAATSNSVGTTQNNVPASCNYAIVNGTSLAPQPGNSSLKLKIMKYFPSPVATNTTSDQFLVTQPNSCVLQSLLTSNDQILANLYTDFSKYGINIENSDPPIQYENVMDSMGTSSLTDMVLEGMVLQKPTEPTQKLAESAQKPAEPTQNPVQPTQKAVQPLQKLIQLKPKPIHLTQKPVQPKQKAVQRSVLRTPVQPTQTPAQPTQTPVHPTQSPVHPTQTPVQPTKKSVRRTPVQPTQTPVQVTQNSVLRTPVQPTQTLVQLVQSPVQTTQKSVLRARTPVQTTPPPAQPTQARVQPTQTSIQSTQEPPEASINQDKINDEVICISDDDDNDTIDKSSSDFCNFMNSNEDEMVQLLFRKHLSNKLHKDSQTFHPTDALIHRTRTNLIALPNMVGELKRYKIPIDLKFSATNVAHFENNVPHGLNRTMDKWTREECTDISNLPNITPVLPNKNIGPPNVIKHKPISTLWHHTFVERLNNTMQNNQNIAPSMPTITTVPITTVQSNVTYQNPSNIIQTSAAIATCDENVIPVTVSNMNPPPTQQTEPLVLNGANSLSLRSLLLPTKNVIGKLQEMTSSPATNTHVKSPLLHNYLQTIYKIEKPKSVAVSSSSNEQMQTKCDDIPPLIAFQSTSPPIVIDDTTDTVTQSDVPPLSKIRVKSLSELLQKV